MILVFPSSLLIFLEISMIPCKLLKYSNENRKKVFAVHCNAVCDFCPSRVIIKFPLNPPITNQLLISWLHSPLAKQQKLNFPNVSLLPGPIIFLSSLCYDPSATNCGSIKFYQIYQAFFRISCKTFCGFTPSCIQQFPNTGIYCYILSRATSLGAPSFGGVRT